MHPGSTASKGLSLGDSVTPAAPAEGVFAPIVGRLSLELGSMKMIMDGDGGRDTIDSISSEMCSQLSTIQGLIAEGRIRHPYNLRLSLQAMQGSPCSRPLRVGVFPIAG